MDIAGGGAGRRDGARATIERATAGWPEIDLRAALKGLPVNRAGGGPTSAAAAWSGAPTPDATAAIVLSFANAGAAPVRSAWTSLGEVPASAFVSIGRVTGTATAGGTVPLRSAGRSTANDNVAASTRRPLWRELFTLTLLAVTLAAVFWSGRLHAYQKVIVVPGPSSYRSVVT